MVSWLIQTVVDMGTGAPADIIGPSEMVLPAGKDSSGVIAWIGALLLRLVRPWILYVQQSYEEAPEHVILETICIISIIYLLLHRRMDPNGSRKLTPKEEEELIQEWEPIPLVPPVNDGLRVREIPIIEGAAENGFVTVAGESRRKLNMVSWNFLGLSNIQSIKDACKRTIVEFGVGSCGPRGFYGTLTPHLLFESEMTKFMGVEESILYSDSIATISSVIPAFSKAGDLIVCDDSASRNIKAGIKLSRSRAIFFKHNDMHDLQRVLNQVKSEDQAHPRRGLYRRFIIVEGLYLSTGNICPLKDVVMLKNEYCYRLIVDDSMGIGVLGGTGRGTCEHLDVDISEVEIWVSALDTSLGSVGGVCCGTKQIVDHQRLSGAGYVFSASSPMYACTAAVEALKMIDQDPTRGATVQASSRTFRQALDGAEDIKTEGDVFSPIVRIRLSDRHDNEKEIYHRVAAQLFTRFHTMVGVTDDDHDLGNATCLFVMVGYFNAAKQLLQLAKNIKIAFSDVLASDGGEKKIEKARGVAM